MVRARSCPQSTALGHSQQGSPAALGLRKALRAHGALGACKARRAQSDAITPMRRAAGSRRRGRGDLKLALPHIPGGEGRRDLALFSPFTPTDAAKGAAQHGSTAAAAPIGPDRLPSPRGCLGRRDHGGGAEQDGDPDPLQAASGSAGQQGSGERPGSAGLSVPGYCSAAADCAPTGPQWAPGGAAAAVGAAGQGPLGSAWAERPGPPSCGGGGGAAEPLPQPGCPSAFALVVLRLRRQEPELGQYHLRGLPVHRLLWRPQVPGRTPQLHQVRGERYRRHACSSHPASGWGTHGSGGKPYPGAVTSGVTRLDRGRFWVTQHFQNGVSKASQVERRHVAFTNLAEMQFELGILGRETRVWCVNLVSKAAVWCT